MDASLPVIADGLKMWSLRVNQEKTEWIHISRSSRDWHHSKQLGSLLGEDEDLKRRISQASQAYGRMYSLWLRRQIVPAVIRLRLCNAIVLPTLLYNCETWGLPTSVLTRLDTLDMVSILPCTLNRTLLVPSSQNTVQMLSFGRSEGQSNVCTQRYDLRFFWWIFSTFKRLLRRPRTAGPTIAHE